jgi:hypothetical protein
MKSVQNCLKWREKKWGLRLGDLKKIKMKKRPELPEMVRNLIYKFWKKVGVEVG